MRNLLFVLLVMLGLAAAIAGHDMVVINSIDGRDVLSGLFYANTQGTPARFLTSTGGSIDTLVAKVGRDKSVLLIQSRDSPVSAFLRAELEKNNNRIETYESPDGAATNLELGRKSHAASFVVVDSAYADGALSALPFAARQKAYVLMADKNNIEQVKEVAGSSQVYVYGRVDGEVLKAFSGLPVRRIGDGQDKYADNIQLVKMQMDRDGDKYVIASDGTLLEDAMINGTMPILLVGRILPRKTYDFLKESVRDDRLDGVLLIGNDLTYTMYDARERLRQDLLKEGMNKTYIIRIKFAQSVPGTNGGSVLGLDVFSLPIYKPSLNISEVAYNSADKRVMATVSNVGEGPAYYTLEVRVSANGKQLKVMGDSQVRPIERGESGGQSFDLDLSNIQEGNVTALAAIKYGSAPDTLEDYGTYTGQLASIEYSDMSNMSIAGARYDQDRKGILVSLRNVGDVPAYASTHLTMNISGRPATLSGPASQAIAPGSLVVDEIPLELSEQELAGSPTAMVSVDFGGRPGFLRHKIEKTVPLAAFSGADNGLWLAGGALAVLAMGAGAWLMMRKAKPKAMGS